MSAPAALAILLFAQAVTNGPAQPSFDQRLNAFVARESLISPRLSHVIFDDAAMRAEIRRVGFERGCRAMDASRTAVMTVQSQHFVQPTIKAIRTVVPLERLEQTRLWTFTTGLLSIYRKRIDAELDRAEPALIATTYAKMRAAFLGRTRILPTTVNPTDNEIRPHPVTARFGSLKGVYDLDNPAHAAMACVEILYPYEPAGK